MNHIKKYFSLFLAVIVGLITMLPTQQFTAYAENFGNFSNYDPIFDLSNPIKAVNTPGMDGSPWSVQPYQVKVRGKDFALFCADPHRKGLSYSNSKQGHLGSIADLYVGARPGQKGKQAMTTKAYHEGTPYGPAMISDAMYYILKNWNDNKNTPQINSAGGMEANQRAFTIATQLAIWSVVDPDISKVSKWTANPHGDLRLNQDIMILAKRLHDEAIKNGKRPVLKLEVEKKSFEMGDVATSKLTKGTFKIVNKGDGEFDLTKPIKVSAGNGDPTKSIFKSGGQTLTPVKEDGSWVYTLPVGQTEFTIEHMPLPNQEYKFDFNAKLVPYKGIELISAQPSDPKLQRYAAIGEPSGSAKGGTFSDKGVKKPEQPGEGGSSTSGDNKKITWKVEKVDTAGKPLSGVEFKATRIAGGTYKFTAGKFEAHGDGNVNSNGGSATVTDEKVVQFDGGQGTAEGEFNSTKFTAGKIEGIDLVKPKESYVATTDGSGLANFDNMPTGTYIVEEISTIEGYRMDGCKQVVTVTENSNGKTVLKFVNSKNPGLTIMKVSAVDGSVITEGSATFRIRGIDTKPAYDNTVSTQGGTLFLENLNPGAYEITEVTAPEGYVKYPKPITLNVPATVNGQADVNVTFTFPNMPKPKLQVIKFDEKTGKPLKDAQFRIMNNEDMATPIAEGKTDEEGKFTSDLVDFGTYTIEEINPPPGYTYSDKTPRKRTIVLNQEKYAGKTVQVKFDNIKLPTLVIEKTDASTGKGVPGTRYTVEHRRNGAWYMLGNGFTTDKDGRIVLPNVEPGDYRITETEPAQGMTRGTVNSWIIHLAPGDNAYGVNAPAGAGNQGQPNPPVGNGGNDAGNGAGNQNPGTGQNGNNNQGTNGAGGTTVIPGGQFNIVNGNANWPTSAIVVKKADKNTGQMLNGATFELIKVSGNISGSNGTTIATGTTDTSGVVVFAGLQPGNYIVKETIAPQNYYIDTTNTQQANLKADGTSTVELIFRNIPFGSVTITKTDADTGELLGGAEFEVKKPNGAMVGNATKFVTDAKGEVTIPNLEPGSYVIKEIKAPNGYVIKEDAKTIEIGTKGENIKVPFYNKKALGIRIEKVDANNGMPLQGAEFSVADGTGRVLANVVTDQNGVATANVPDGTYVVTETKAPYGYVLKCAPKTVVVESGKITVAKFENSKLGGAIIKKLDSTTRRPLRGAVIQIHEATGYSAHSTSGKFVGEFTTDEAGIINLPAMKAGTYIAKEVKAPEGYNLAEPKIFTINNIGSAQHSANNTPTIAGLEQGPMEVVIYDDPLGTSILHKTDSVTGKPVKGAVYQVIALDGSHGRDIQGQRLIVGGYQSGLTINLGTVETNEAGIANISHLPQGWYSIQEIEAPEGYEVDPRSYNFQITGDGYPTIIRVKDTPIMGNIVITKRAGAYSKATGKNTGVPLSGAVYAVIDKDGTQVDEIVTDRTGTGRSKDLKLGQYALIEVKAPDYYMLDQTPIRADIRRQGQVTHVEAKNQPLRLGVTIKKTSDQKTANCRDTINYYISGVHNTSNVPLDNFYVLDRLPDPRIAQVQKFDTGMWNKFYNFRVSYATNLNSAFTTLPGTYNSRQHHQIDLNAGNLGLRSNEWVTQVRMEFEETVDSNFMLIEPMSMQLVVQNGVKSGTQFTNYALVSGEYQGNIVKAQSHWTIKMKGCGYKKQGRLPKTGW
ncbi:SpaA isopeptide-forming pilin-related protein [Filifactor alocis]|uniref:SpaA isopeptide-forming pilin-related protein n=1 Tax=Filifactor alocis TaxID=143361 RepID=UPI003FA1278B